MSERKGFWNRIKGAGRRKVISAVVVVGLAAVGVALPPEVVTAIVGATDLVIEAM